MRIVNDRSCVRKAALRAGCYQEALDASERAIALQGGRSAVAPRSHRDQRMVWVEMNGFLEVFL